MKKRISILALCGLLLLGASLVGCRSNQEGDDNSNGGVVGSTISSMMSKVSDAMDGSSLRSDPTSDTDEELTSPVFWEAPRYY